MTAHKLSLFIFRRDLRLHDNTALIAALKQSEQVIPCFIFDERQTTHNAYFSHPAFRFMLESLKDLESQLKKNQGQLYLLSGTAENVVAHLFKELPIDAVYFNRDYTPFSLARDAAIQKAAETAKRRCYIFGDALLHEPEEITKQDGKPYTIYTPFLRKSRSVPVSKPARYSATHFYTAPIASHDSNAIETRLSAHSKSTSIIGGRTQGKKLLANIAHIKNYDENRNFPALDATSHLSAHHKFGTMSIRESHQIIIETQSQSSLINELYWRDFFTHIGFHFPVVFEAAFHEKYRALQWENRVDYFDRWCRGETGFPIVDAGMRELNETGYMHNRVRMITASFLIKDLHIDWRWGERYFAQKLVDYDPAVNNGNWQWSASTGCDAQPYFRIFNPWLQQKRFDESCDYIKKWIPELTSIAPKTLHELFKNPIKIPGYSSPMVDHATQSAITKIKYAL